MLSVLTAQIPRCPDAIRALRAPPAIDMSCLLRNCREQWSSTHLECLIEYFEEFSLVIVLCEKTSDIPGAEEGLPCESKLVAFRWLLLPRDQVAMLPNC